MKTIPELFIMLGIAIFIIMYRNNKNGKSYKEVLNNIIEKIKQLIDIKKIDEIGLKKLAYEINKNKTGYYVVIYYKATSQAVLEIERFYRINDDVLRFITVKKAD